MSAVHSGVRDYDNRVKMAERLAVSADVSVACIGIVDCTSRRLVNVWVGHGETDTDLLPEEAVKIVSRALATFLSLRQPGPASGSSSKVRTVGETEAESWIRSDRYLIGIGEQVGTFAPVAALVNPSAAPEIPAGQQSLLHIGLTYAEQLRQEQFGQENGLGKPDIRSRIPDIILRSLSFGFAVTDTSGTLGYMTDLSAKWLREHEELHIVDGRLTARGAQNQKILQNAMAAATTTPGKFSIVQLIGTGELPKTIIVLPVDQSPSLALVVFGNAQGDAVLREQLLQALGLTVAERRLAQQLLAGKSLAAAAEENNLTIATARSYLKRIFAKTGIHRQSQLITLYHTLVPPLLVGAQPDPEQRQH